MKRIIFGLAFIGLALNATAQKSNTTNAALAYKSSETNFNKQDLEAAYNDLKEAKEYIDKSAVHDDTKNDPKTLMYKGKIYIDYSIVGPGVDGASFEFDSEQMREEGFKAFEDSKANDPKEKYADYIDEYCQLRSVIYAAAGSMAYDEKKYADAYEPFYLSTMFSEATGKIDSTLYILGAYSALEVDSLEDAAWGFEKAAAVGFALPESVGNLSYIYQKTGQTEKGDAFFAKMTEMYPNNQAVLSEKINYLLNTDRKEEAVDVLNKAIEVDPDNADYHFVAATVHQNLGNFEESEKSFLKTLELNPEHTDASFGLGGLYFNKGADLNNEARAMDLSDPNYQPTLDASKENFNKALPHLEKAHADAPDDRVILISLQQLYGKLGMTDKFKETKAKIAALDAQ